MRYPINHRKAERRPIALPAACRTLGGMRDKGVLSDLSTHGCCVTTSSRNLNVGQRVIIKPDGIEGLSGVVRWIDRARAGIEFDAPLYGPVAEFIINRCAGLRQAGMRFAS